MILFHEVNVQRREGEAHVLNKTKSGFAREIVVAFQVIEKYAANSSGLFAMLQVKVIVGPPFELRIVGVVMLVTHGSQRPVKVCCIFTVDVMWRQINTATE